VQLRCRIGRRAELDALDSDQIAWASSANAAATRLAGGAPIPSSYRIFEVALAAARAAGLLGRRRVLDSTPLYDAVATMDTITLIHAAIRGLLGAADTDLAGRLRSVLLSGDDYTSSAKPVIDWDGKSAREDLVDSRARAAFPTRSSLGHPGQDR
jgi:hypothetical protein